MFQNNLLMAAASTADATFTVDYSCRFNPADNAYLSSTLGTPSSTTAFTMSTWVKRGALGAFTTMFSSYKGSGSGDRSAIYFRGSDNNALTVTGEEGASTPLTKTTTQLFRDPGAWYNIVVSFDLTASSSTYCRVYINGSQVTSFSTDTVPSADQALAWNRDGYRFTVGSDALTLASDDFDGYLSQTCLIDGLTLSASSFGEFNNGVWRPIDITGLTFGNNGFLLDYADSSDLGNDVSGNNNDFTSSGLAANDQVVDTPTDNYATLNPLNANSVTQITDGNLHLSQDDNASSTISYPVPATIRMNTGKFAIEGTVPTQGPDTPNPCLGIATLDTFDRDDNVNSQSTAPVGYFWANPVGSNTYEITEGDGGTGDGDYTPADAPDAADGDVLQMYVDNDAGKVWWGVNGTILKDVSGNLGDPAAGTNPNLTFTANSDMIVYASCWGYNAGAYHAMDMDLNFGQNTYADTPPSGFKALSTANLATPAIKDGSKAFQTTLYTGNGSTRNIDQTGNSTFKPDLVWLKNRDEITSPPDPGKDDFKLVDAVRGVTKELMCNTNDVESTDANGVTSFDADGFGLGTGADGYNVDTEKFVAWQWLAGGGAGSSNEVGTINTTTTSVNTAAGISMGTYTGTGSAATIGHGLGAVPKFIIVKERTDDAADWYVYHASMSAAPETDYLVLNETATPVDDSTVWNDTAPTSTVFSIGTNDDVNGSSDTYVYYAFAEIEGFSSFGSYEGTNSTDGAFISLGFLPAWVCVHNNDLARNWWTVDSTRDTFNPVDEELLLDVNYGEDIGLNDTLLDFLSTGFKMRLAGSGNTANTFLYMAFAKNPFGGSGTTPMTAF